MKGNTIIKSVLAAIFLLLVGNIKLSAAASGIWTNTASGKLWSSISNWTNGIVADGIGSTADFSQVNIPAGTTTVHMDASHTLTALIFGDSNSGTAGSWLMDDNSSSGVNTLTLAGSNPTITVNALGTSATATISAVIAGTTGWTKLGSSLLVLSGSNTYDAPTTISTISSSTVALSVNSIGVVGGGASALGAPTTAANGQVNLGKFANLTYTGGAATSDRVFSLSQSGGNAAMANNGSGTLTLSGGVNNPGGCSQFILRGAANITGSGTLNLGTASLLKTDAGTVTLTASNNYSGGTTVSTGTLLVNNTTGSGTGSGNVTVSSGATFGGMGSISGNVIFNTGANASFTVGLPMTIGGNLTLGNNTVHLNIPGSLTNGIYALATYNNTGTTGSFTASPVADSGTIPAGAIVGVSAAGGMITLTVSNPPPANYYVATNGSDANAGTLTQPFLTIQKAASLAGAGATVYIRAGTYREMVTVLTDGTSNAPITFQAYSNEVVTIDGTDPITGWSTTGGNIWTAPMNWTLGYGDQVFINGAMEPGARWPNAGSSFPWQNSSIKPSPDWSYAVTAGYSNNTNGWFTDTNLPTRPDGYWNGAVVHILSGKGWIMNHLTVLSYTNATKTIVTGDANGANSAYALTAGNEYYITGIKGELDNQGEWFYQTNTLFLYSTNTPSGVTAKHRSFGFDLRGQSFINLVNLGFSACNILNDTNSTDGTYSGLLMQFPGYSSENSTNSGLTLHDRCVLRNSELAGDSRYLLSVAGSDIRVINNNLHDSGYVPTWDAMVSGSGCRNLFSHNSLQHSGRGLMGSMGRAAMLEYNDLSDAMKLTSDGAAFYTYFEAGNTMFRYNLIHDCPGPKGHVGNGIQGFYLDSENSNWIVSHNIIWNIPGSAFQINCRHNFDQFFNNTTWGNGNALTTGFTADGETGTHVFNNLFNASPSGSQWTNADVRINLNSNPVFRAPSSGDFRLQTTSPAIGAATPIPGVTDGFMGMAPDLGALEYGGVNWATNVGWSATPPSPDPAYNFPTVVFANQVNDGSFESGILAPNWATNASGSLTLLYSSASAWTDARLRTGNYGLQFNVGTSVVSQVVTGLLANCAYKAYAGIQTTNPVSTVQFGITNCGSGGPAMLIPAKTNPWTMYALSFTTGPTNTSVQIYLNVSIPNGGTPVYADDFGLEVNTLAATNAAPYSAPSAPVGLSPTAVSNRFVSLKWNTSAGAIAYNLKRALVAGGPYTNAATQIAATNFTDATVSAATTFYYTVSAVNGFGESTNSAPVSVTTATNPIVLPPVITNAVMKEAALILQGTNGQPGSVYYILTTTNVALPLSFWLTNTTGYFSGIGGFSNVIIVDLGSQQQFYRVRTP